MKKKRKVSREPKLKEYLVMNTFDGNDTFTVTAYTMDDAKCLALSELGWAVCVPEDELHENAKEDKG